MVLNSYVIPPCRVGFGRVDAHADAVVLVRRRRIVADDAHRHVVNAGIAVLIQRADMALETQPGFRDCATRRRLRIGAHGELEDRRRDANILSRVVQCSLLILAGRTSAACPAGHDASRAVGRLSRAIVVRRGYGEAARQVVLAGCWHQPIRLP